MTYIKLEKMNRVLTVAGSDSGGGAGIQADLKTITLLGGVGMSVITALTAQNSIGVQSVCSVPAVFVGQQMDSVLSDLGADAVKLGMLHDASVVSILADRLSYYSIGSVVIDPVMVASDGTRLLDSSAIEIFCSRLLPMATVVTPNIQEAQVLSRHSIRNDEDVRIAARIIHQMGPGNVLVKGGHRGQDVCNDVFFDGSNFTELSRPRVHTPHTHGTGCVSSAAIATFLGAGDTVADAVARTKSFIHSTILFAFPIGRGRGFLNLNAPVARELEKYATVLALQKAVRKLTIKDPVSQALGDRWELAYALPFAENAAHVAAYKAPNENGINAQNGQPGMVEDWIQDLTHAFGQDDETSSMVLSVMALAPERRCAMRVIRAYKLCDDVGKRASELGLSVEILSLGSTPGREQSSIGKAAVADVIVSAGESPLEAVLWLLGNTPEAVVDMACALVTLRG